MKRIKIRAVKCKYCGIPLTGWRYRFIVKPLCRITSTKPDVCCKCAGKEDKEDKQEKN